MTSPIPDVLDTGRRVARTAVQAGLAVFTGAATLAAVYQLLIPVIGTPTRATLIPWLTAAAIAIGSNAALLARIMAIPAINTVLGRLSGHSGDFIPDSAFVEPSTETQIFRTIDLNAGEFIGDPAH